MPHIAQLNIGRLRAPIDSDESSGFRNGLAPVNADADAAPGFVWRLEDESGDATSFDLFGDPMMIVNLSVWETIEDLEAFVFSGRHRDYLRRRQEWFHTERDHLVVWWVPEGHIPTTAEALEKLKTLRTDGPTAHAFTLRRTFPPPSEDSNRRAG